MKKLLLLALCSGTWDTSFAKDSDWKICKGEVVMFGSNAKLVVNLYEHRYGEGRTNDINFIYGGNILKGSLDSSESTSGAVKLKGTNSSFKGLVSVDYQKGILSLIGKVSINKSISDLNASLECETL
ncbi:MAG: hypothetical protein H7336_08330 [Bacteriovorax sp.]|nr:hypothetical protein [Bacteriovorax sp.]